MEVEENNLNLTKTEEYKITCDVEKEQKPSDTEECGDDKEENSSSTSSSSEEEKSNKEISEAANDEPPNKRRRKRKRRPKKKKNVITAYVPDEPFKSRYKNNLPAFLNTVAPKIHLRFDEATGEADQNKSEFNYKPRIIKALERNLSLKEDIKDLENNVNIELMLEVTQEVPRKFNNEDDNEEIICRKPRIIKAIGY